MIFLSEGLKYQDTTVRSSNNKEGNISFMLSDAICENAAPDPNLGEVMPEYEWLVAFPGQGSCPY